MKVRGVGGWPLPWKGFIKLLKKVRFEKESHAMRMILYSSNFEIFIGVVMFFFRFFIHRVYFLLLHLTSCLEIFPPFLTEFQFLHPESLMRFFEYSSNIFRFSFLPVAMWDAHHWTNIFLVFFLRCSEKCRPLVKTILWDFPPKTDIFEALAYPNLTYSM